MTEYYEIDERTNQVSKAVAIYASLVKSLYFQLLAFKVERQATVPIKIDNFSIPTELKIDLLVEDRVIVELKSVEKIMPIHHAQVQTYLKLANKPLGLLINFNVLSLKDGIKRIAMSKTNAQRHFA